MEQVKDLLEKYFRAETTLAEENRIKEYFRTHTGDTEFEMYRPLFQNFELEKQEKPLKPIQNIQPEKKKIQKWIQAFAYTGLAASIALALWVYRPHSNDNFAMVSGVKMQDTEYAEKYAAKKLNKVNELLNRSMRPMQNIETVRRDLQPMQKLNNVKDKMNDIQNKIQFK